MRKKLFYSYVLLIIFLSVIIGNFTINVWQKYYIKDYTENIIDKCKILSDILSENYNLEDEDSVNSFAKNYSNKLGLRITIVNSLGEVEADSVGDKNRMENHLNRKEIATALNGEVGSQTRESETLKIKYIYAAVPVYLDGNIYALRLSAPILKLSTIKSQVIVYLTIGIIFAAIIAFLFAGLFSNKLMQPLNELIVSANEISKGNYDKNINISRDDQIGILSESFNKMRKKLKITVDQLEKENLKLESIVNSMINGVIALDNNNNIILINSICYKLLNIKDRNLAGNNIYNVIRDENIYEVLEHTIKYKVHKVKEFSYKSPLEGNKILRIYANPIINEDMPNYMFGTLLVFQDITQIRKLEQLRSDFVSNVTHELKTPLTSIMGFTDTLKSGAINDPEAANRFLDIISIESERLYRLILDILSLSEIETRESDVNLENGNIEDIILNASNILQPIAASKGLKLNVEIEEKLPLFLCNKDRISQVFMNLIDNAIKYTEQGSINVTCKKEKNKLVVKVSDTGIGIPESSLNRIFERFYRVDKGRSRKAGGTGLGLSIVKHIVLLYRGSIRVESDEGKGSCFTIKLPYKNK